MSDERQIEPTLAQHLESVRDELRARQRALEPMPRENADLHGRIERLEAEKEVLHRELELLRQGQPVEAPRLPESLAAPFDVKVQRSLRMPLVELLFASLCVGVSFGKQGLEAWPVAAIAWGGLAAVLLLFLLAPPRWRFEATWLKASGLNDTSTEVSYTNVRDVQVVVTQAQQRRGVGTLVLRCSMLPGDPEETLVVIRNVPEPERLAEWLRSQCRGAR